MLRLTSLKNFQRSFSLLKVPKLQKRNWKQNVVYLYQFKRSPVVPTLSPFCIKLETFLRANNINYKTIGSWFLRSKEGRVPFIELNGEQISDSQIIIWRLVEHFGINERLSSEQEGISRTIDRMLEGSTYYAITYFRSIENAENMVNKNVSGLMIPSFLTPFIAKKIRKNAETRLKNEGIGNHSREIIIEILRRDVKALDQILGEKKFLMGVRPTIADFSLYGHLGVGYFLPFHQPITDLLNNNFPRIRLLLERIHAHYWSDYKFSENFCKNFDFSNKI